MHSSAAQQQQPALCYPTFPPPALLHTSPQVGRLGGLLLGAQTAPMLQLDSLFAGGGLLDRPAWATAVRQCQLATSYAVAYQPSPGAGTYGGRFTAAVELVRGGTGLGNCWGCV